MSADLQAEINAKLGNTLAALDQVKARLDSLGAATTKSGRASQDYQKKTEGMLRSVGSEAKEAGHALHQLGGAAGHVAGHLGRAIGMSGGFSRLAVGAGLAALAFEAFNKVVEANIERTKVAIETQKKFYEAVEAGKKAQGAGGIAGAAQMADVGALLASKNPKAALDRANITARHGILDAATARKASAYVERLPEGTRMYAMDVAEMVAMGGGDPMAALHSIGTAPGFQSMLAKGKTDEVASQLYATQTGTRYDAGYGKRARDAYEQNPYLEEAAKTRGNVNRVDEANRALTTQFGSDASGEALGKAASPMAAAMVDFNRSIAEQIANFDRLAEAQGKFAAALAAMTPSGSFNTQKTRLQNAVDAAQQQPVDAKK